MVKCWVEGGRGVVGTGMSLGLVSVKKTQSLVLGWQLPDLMKCGTWEAVYKPGYQVGNHKPMFFDAETTDK